MIPHFYISACSNSVQYVKLQPILLSKLLYLFEQLTERISKVEHIEDEANSKKRGCIPYAGCGDDFMVGDSGDHDMISGIRNGRLRGEAGDEHLDGGADTSDGDCGLGFDRCVSY